MGLELGEGSNCFRVTFLVEKIRLVVLDLWELDFLRNKHKLVGFAIWITKANYVEDFKVKLTFNDGLSATVDLKDHLDGKIFEPLKNVEFFIKFELDSWTLTWPNDSDFLRYF